MKCGYGINYKYEGMLACSFDRFHVITKFILQTLDDLKLSPIRHDKECSYIQQIDDQDDDHIKGKYERITFLLCNIETIHGFL